VHYRQQDRRRAHRGRNLVEVDQTVPIDRDDRDLGTVEPLRVLAGGQDGGVLGCLSNDVRRVMT